MKKTILILVLSVLLVVIPIVEKQRAEAAVAIPVLVAGAIAMTMIGAGAIFMTRTGLDVAVQSWWKEAQESHREAVKNMAEEGYITYIPGITTFTAAHLSKVLDDIAENGEYEFVSGGLDLKHIRTVNQEFTGNRFPEFAIRTSDDLANNKFVIDLTYRTETVYAGKMKPIMRIFKTDNIFDTYAFPLMSSNTINRYKIYLDKANEEYVVYSTQDGSYDLLSGVYSNEHTYIGFEGYNAVKFYVVAEVYKVLDQEQSFDLYDAETWGIPETITGEDVVFGGEDIITDNPDLVIELPQLESLDLLIGKSAADLDTLSGEATGIRGVLERILTRVRSMGTSIVDVLASILAAIQALTFDVAIDFTVGNLDELELPQVNFAEEISTRFPFSIPFDLKRILEGMVYEGELPEFQLRIPLPAEFGGGVNFSISIPSEFGFMVTLVRSTLMIIFVIGIIYMTRLLLGGAV